MDVKLSEDEAAILRMVLSRIVLAKRMGELGIMHGLDRFVSTDVCLKGQEVKDLKSAMSKCGIALRVRPDRK